MSLSRQAKARASLPVGALGVVILILAALVVSCAPAAPASPLTVVPAPTPAPAMPEPVVLPADEAPHDALNEWWYYTGHLKTSSGKEYGFEFVIFQAVRKGSPVGYASHFAITDHRRRTFTYEERSETALRIQGDGRFRLDVAGWQMEGDGDDHQLRAAGDNYTIDLRLRSIRPPMLHNGVGWISFGPVGDSYYYTRSRMEIKGSIVDGGHQEEVAGLAWMDHQWGNFIVVNGGGWDWFSLQLSDGSDVMATVLRNAPGNLAAVYGTYMSLDGVATDLRAEDVEIAANGSWTSPHSGSMYPSGWTVRLPEQSLILEIEPVLADQELNTQKSTGVSYWEGDVRVTGTRNGTPVTGQGYVELTGYSR